MGRAPMAQPPGSDTRASPWRATSGPSTSAEARMVFTSSYGASKLFTPAVSTRVTALPLTSAPSWPRSFFIVFTSPRLGTLRYTDFPEASRDEARIGNAAFLAPDTRTSPFRRGPPVTTILSIHHPEPPIGSVPPARDRRPAGSSGCGRRFGLLALAVLVAATGQHRGLATAFLAADLVRVLVAHVATAPGDEVLA